MRRGGAGGGCAAGVGSRSLPPVRPISGAIPGFGTAVGVLGGQLARRPAPFLAVIGIITFVLGIASTRLETVFDPNDFLPAGGDAAREVAKLDAAFGGSTDVVDVLIEAEITDDRTWNEALHISSTSARTGRNSPRIRDFGPDVDLRWTVWTDFGVRVDFRWTT